MQGVGQIPFQDPLGFFQRETMGFGKPLHAS